MGQVVAVEGLCQLASSDDKDTIRVEVDLGESGLQYTPGDALGVYPLNCTQVGYLTCPSEEVVQMLNFTRLMFHAALEVHSVLWLCHEAGSWLSMNVI